MQYYRQFASLRRFAALLLIPLPLWGQRTVPRPPAADVAATENTTLRMDVRLINVFATVTDKHGTPAGGLEKKDFRLYEDGVEQEVRLFERESTLPLSIVLGIDASLSTRKDLPLELDAARRFTTAVLRPKDAMALYEFDEKVSELTGFSADAAEIGKALGRVKPGTATALYDTIYLASGALARHPGRRVMVLITDGGDTASTLNYQQALQAAQSAEAMIYSIIMVPIEADAGRDLGGEHALIQLSEDTGGSHYYATDLAQLAAAFQQISQQLRTQYLLAYYPSQKNGRDFHAIRVETPRTAADGSALQVQCRAGYYASKPE